jgi:hypothetical protein
MDTLEGDEATSYNGLNRLCDSCQSGVPDTELDGVVHDRESLFFDMGCPHMRGSKHGMVFRTDG